MKIAFFEKLKERTAAAAAENNFTCDLCGGEVFEGERLCRDCYLRLPLNNKKVCPFCGRRVKEEGTCVDCKDKPLGVQKARSACLHEGDAAGMVVRFKGGAKYLQYACAELLLPIMQSEFDDVDFITYVPVTPKREKERGYNQSRLIAKLLSQKTGVPLFEDIVKVRDTADQKTLTRKERESNLAACFRLLHRKPLREKKVLIIDDTLTTGATASVVAELLKRAGAKNEYLLTVTSVEKKNPFFKAPDEK